MGTSAAALWPALFMGTKILAFAANKHLSQSDCRKPACLKKLGGPCASSYGLTWIGPANVALFPSGLVIFNVNLETIVAAGGVKVTIRLLASLNSTLAFVATVLPASSTKLAEAPGLKFVPCTFSLFSFPAVAGSGSTLLMVGTVAALEDCAVALEDGAEIDLTIFCDTSSNSRSEK